ncbi:MAG: hypothetical protein GF419_01400 [Ignavibacteriales bacterium]|nr:hypothetical protein [Ignavibacteriales bacterium]
MKNNFTHQELYGVGMIAIVCLVFLVAPIHAQTENTSFNFGINVGYTELDMEEVNDDLIDNRNIFRSLGYVASSPEEIEGGLILGAEAFGVIEKFVTGVSGNYIEQKGRFYYSDYSGSFREEYLTRTIELTVFFGTRLPINENVYFSLRGYVGYGMAEAEHVGEIKDYGSQPWTVKHDVEGGYITTRAQAGIVVKLTDVSVHFRAGYRMAKAGIMRGELVENGVTYDDRGVNNPDGGEIGFDYSGMFLQAGVALEL